MSKPLPPEPVVLLTGLIFHESIPLDGILDELRTHYGEILKVTDPVEFDWTNYYRNEMGESLKRCWVYFKDLILPDEIVELKHISFEIENIYSKDGKRLVNIDPGYIALSNLVLSTYKDYAHRIYIGDRVYAEVTLLFMQNKWHAQEWTFSDYREDRNQKHFTEIREYLKDILIRNNLLRKHVQ